MPESITATTTSGEGVTTSQASGTWRSFASVPSPATWPAFLSSH